MTTGHITASADELTNGEARSNLFPQYLMKLLNDEVAPECLWWLPDGKAFAICPDTIEAQVLDKHFQKTKYSSFIRRLHSEGYRRQTRKYKKADSLKLPEGTVVLSHDAFQRDAPDLLESFYKKTDGDEDPPKPSTTSALRQAKAGHKAAQTRLLELAKDVGVNPRVEIPTFKPLPLTLNAETGASFFGLSAPPARRPSNTEITTALLGSRAATAQDPLNRVGAHFLNNSLVAIHQARLDTSMSLLCGQEGLSYSDILAHSQRGRQAAAATGLSRSSCNDFPALVTLPPPPAGNTDTVVSLLDTGLLLEQLIWDNHRHQWQEQTTQNLRAMEALRLRAAAAYSTTMASQWP